ncbi:RYamide receptor-like [Stylophora pistillata]|uniref:RYamide receptor-like n=1 Tax=Stylophora pistillata TaxID=50429 RepID=UPI000C05597E|nr:RYamide receptor-like [Stylophora pistillata]
MSKDSLLKNSMNNQSGPDDGYPFPECSAEEEINTSQKRFVQATLYSIAMVISLFGNIVVIWTVRKNPRMRNLTHYLIVNMAMADILITVFHMPYKLQVQITGSNAIMFGGLTGMVICKVVGYSQDVSIACSVLTLTAISIDRFMVVMFPLKRATLNHKARSIVIPIWIISIVMCSPLLYVNQLSEYEGEFLCYEEWTPLLFSESDPPGRSYTITHFSLLYVLPLIVITVLYSGITIKVWNRQIPGQRHLRHVRPHSAARKKLVRMLIVIVCLFAVSWLPYHVIFLLLFYSKKYLVCQIPETVSFYCLFVGHANSAMNPCVYFAIHKEYRRGLMQVTRSICCGRSSPLLGCIIRRKSSFNLQVNSGLVDQTESPSSNVEMTHRNQFLEFGNSTQVVVTNVSQIRYDNVL